MAEIRGEAAMELPRKVESHERETDYEKLEADAEPKLEVESRLESESAETIDKSFKADDPFQWFKWTFPRALFTILMIAETVDLVSDCLQLQEVVVKFGKYAAPPFIKAGTFDKRYSVIWEKVDKVTESNITDPESPSHSLLGYKLAWEGTPSGVRVSEVEKQNYNFFELDCLANGEFEGEGHLLFSNELQPSARGSMYQSEEVCVSLLDVFNLEFEQPFPKDPKGARAFCPNNATGIFDESSFTLRQTFSDDIDNYGCSDYGCGKDIYVTSETKEPLWILDLYKPNWVASILSVSQCNTLYAIYVATIICFTLSSACVILQVLQFSARLWRDPPDNENVADFKKERVQALVEFPMIGFLLALICLDDEGWDIYAEIDYSYNQMNPEYYLISKILGFHDRNNLLHAPIWAYYHVQDEENPPKSVTLGQKIFHHFYYPLSSGFKDVVVGDGSFRCLLLAVYYCVFPGLCAWCLVFFSVVLIPLILMVLAYSDKLLLGRILFDIPNFCLALAYIVVIESNFASILSCLFSGFLILYYLSGIFYQFYLDMVRTKPPPQMFPIDNCYGKVTARGEAFYQAFVMPFTEVLTWWIIIPAAVFRNSLVYASPDDDGSESHWNLKTVIHLLCSCIIPAGMAVFIILFTNDTVKHLQESDETMFETFL